MGPLSPRLDWRTERLITSVGSMRASMRMSADTPDLEVALDKPDYKPRRR
jgi:hypothetical protein